MKIYDSNGNNESIWASIGSGIIYEIEIGDFDLNRKKEIAFVDSASTDRLFVVNYTLSHLANTSLEQNPYTLKAGDINNDGYQELAVGIYSGTNELQVYNYSSNNLNSIWTYDLSNYVTYNDLDLFDMNNDGILDLVFGSYDNKNNLVVAKMAGCSVQFSDQSFQKGMLFNASTGLYQYNRSFNLGGNYLWNASCNRDYYLTKTVTNKNITIISPPIISIIYPVNNSNYNINVSTMNYSVTSTSTLGLCWYSLNNGLINSSGYTAGTNFTNLLSNEGWNNWTVYCNDTSNYLGKNLTTFYKDTIPPAFVNISNRSIEYYNAFDYNINTTDTTNTSCFTVNDTINFNINCTGYLRNNTILNLGTYWLNITVNDTLNNKNSSLIFVNVTDTIIPQINFITSTPNNATITTNTSLEINVSISEINLNQLIYNWNQTNYTMYNDNLVLMMNFDNLSSLRESSSVFADISKYGNNGICSGTSCPNWTSSGKFGGAYRFDGSNDYINLGSSPKFDYMNLTVCAWINTSSNSLAMRIAKGGSTNTYKWLFIVSSGSVVITDSSTDRLSSTLVNDSRWHHVCGIRNPYLIYIDGINRTGGTMGSWTGGDNATIGAGSSTTFFFNGLIDEVRIWNRSLSATEVYQQYISNLKKFNSTQWYLYLNQSKNVTTKLDYGTYSYQAFATDIHGNLNSTEQRTIVIFNITAPTITIVFPTDGIYSNNNSLDILYGLTYNTLDSCWYNYNGINTTLANCNNITTLILAEGSNNITIYANDTFGNVGSSSVTFTIDLTNPTITINYPQDNLNSNNNTISVNYNASDININSCWYSNDTMTINTTLPGCANITSVTWSERQHNVTIWANDSAGNIGSNSTRFIIDQTVPTIIIIYPNNYTNTTNKNLEIIYSVSDDYLDSCWYGNDTMTINTTLSRCGNITSITWSERQHNVTIWANDSAGNRNSQSVIFTILPDLDHDGLSDNIDPLSYNESNVTTSGITRLNITVGGNKTNESFFGNQEIRFYDQTNLIMNFSHNFSANNFDLSKVKIIKNTNYIIINLSGQLQSNYNKTIYLENNNFISLCVKDAEISGIDEISSSCNGNNETDFSSCLNGNLTINGTICLDSEDIVKVSNLRYSAIRGTTAEPSPSVTTTGGSAGAKGGGGSTINIQKPEIVEKYECLENKECGFDESCWNHKCVKVFDIKIIDVDSPIKDDGNLGFTYFLKGMANINDDVIINYWLEKDGTTISSGQDVIYLKEFEEKTELTKIYIPKNLPSGQYSFYIKVSYGKYQALSYRNIYVEKKDEEIQVALVGHSFFTEIGDVIVDYTYLWTIIFIIIILGAGVYLIRKIMVLKMKTFGEDETVNTDEMVIYEAEVMNYIREARRYLNDNQIVQALLDVGWPKKMVLKLIKIK